MCMACEEADMHYRLQLVEQIAKGEMPAGLTAEDLAELPDLTLRDYERRRDLEGPPEQIASQHTLFAGAPHHPLRKIRYLGSRCGVQLDHVD